MRRIRLTSLIVVLIGFQLVCSVAEAQTDPPIREPRGIYTIFLHAPVIQNAQEVAYSITKVKDLPPYPNPALKTDPTDGVLVSYFCALLSNTATSGIAPLIGWSDLNPTAPDVYTWNYLNDVFKAVNNWNSGNPKNSPNCGNSANSRKTVQLIVSPGIQSPPWVFDEMTSCDGLFMEPAVKVKPDCGYTSLFWEGEPPTLQIPLPMPWNSTYKDAWKKFLVELNRRIKRDDPTGTAFVSIDVGGPTSASTEMILPNADNQKISPYPPSTGAPGTSNNGILTLPDGEATIPNLDAVTAWNMLFINYYGADSEYLNSDRPFVEEWKAAIDMFGKVFSGVTLVLEATSDSLPQFPTANTSLTTPAPGFEEDCSGSPTNADPRCAAVTQVLYYFVNPTVDENSVDGLFLFTDAKETQEAGLNASQDDPDGGFWGIKWLAADTSGGKTPLPATPYDMSQMLGGLQFGEPFSGPGNIQSEGCPQYPAYCYVPFFTPALALYNVLAHYFDGTLLGIDYDYNPPWSGSDVVDGVGNFNYVGAPMNVLQVWDVDILYAGGLSNCTMLQITGNPDPIPPAVPVPPDTSECYAPPPPDGLLDSAQQMLNTAREQIELIAEPAK
jgi:hypothetical protein